jgi:S-phase kinase-associated protein 1
VFKRRRRRRRRTGMAVWRSIPTTGEHKDVNFAEEIILQTNDKKEYVIPRSAIALSKLLNDLLQDVSDDEQQTLVPLANVDAPTFESVADYLTHYIEPLKPVAIEKPLKGPLKDLLPSWDKEYVYNKLFKGDNEKDHELLFKTLMAANFLGVEPLRDLCCAAIANMLRNKTPEQIMEVFNVKEPFTPEEERAIEQQYPWLTETSDGNPSG